MATAKPVAYMKQLCRHFGHKNKVWFDDERGRIELRPDGVSLGSVHLDATAPGVLVLTATAAETEALIRLEQITGGHLERFGRRDGMSVTWSPADSA